MARFKSRRDALEPRSVAEIGAAYELDPDCPRFTSVDARDEDQDTLLHRAAFRGDRRDVRDLIRLGAGVNAPGDLGHTPLHYAAMQGHLEIVELLLAAGADHAALNEDKMTPAQSSESDEVVRLLDSPRRRQRVKSG